MQKICSLCGLEFIDEDEDEIVKCKVINLLVTETVLKATGEKAARPGKRS
jgi:hypothetical protein